MRVITARGQTTSTREVETCTAHAPSEYIPTATDKVCLSVVTACRQEPIKTRLLRSGKSNIVPLVF